jgi:prevent-host-death family protein
MLRINATEARINLNKLIDTVSASHEPVVIVGKKGNAVLLAEDDWNAINESLYLASIPGVCESVRKGMWENTDQMATKLDW